jgi:16S rRNA processing protein RimM
VPDRASRLEVARVAKAHGLRGEVVVVPITNHAERFAPGAELWSDERRLVVAASRPSRDAFIVRFERVDDRNAAEALRGAVLRAAVPGAPPPGEVWVHEVIGAEVRDRDGARLGRVVSVEANPAHDLLVLDDDTLIPMVFVVEQGADHVVVALPDGLREL